MTIFSIRLRTKTIWTGLGVMLLMALVALPFVALADNVNYGIPVSSVSPSDMATINPAGDGTIFVNAVASDQAYDLFFTLNTWAQPDRQRNTYPISTPVTARKLSGIDWSGNTKLSLNSGNFLVQITP